MMKKYIALLIAILAMSFCLSFTVSADFDQLTISEDFQAVTLDGITYHRVDATYVILNDYFLLEEEPQLTPKQQELLRGCRFDVATRYNYLEATFFFRDGSTLSCSYATDEFAPTLEAYQKDDSTKCSIEFYMENAYVKESQLKGRPTTLNSRDLEYCDTYSVSAVTDDACFYIETGSLIVTNGKFYYADLSELEPMDPHNFYVFECDSLACYEVTDSAACSKIQKALRNYTAFTEGTESMWDIVTAVFYIFLFAVIPAAIMILSLIFCIRGKGYYRYTWGITAGFAASTLIVFVIVFIKLLMS